MVSQVRSSPRLASSDVALSTAQAWLQNALNALYSGADPAQATAMLRKVEEHLSNAVQATGTQYIDSAQFSSSIRFGVKMDRGQRRQGRPNEDNFFATSGMLPAPLNLPFGFFIVADGMGGHGNGQMASGIVIQRLVDIVIPRLLAGERRIHSLLVESIQSAHQAILQRSQEGAGAEGMGSLVTAALIIGETATIANVGDSRTYLYRPGYGLQQITKDHSTVATMVDAGLIGPEDVYTHPRRNEVYRALGGINNPIVEVDLFTLVLEEGDKMLLCSDGVWEMVRDEQLEMLMEVPQEPIYIAHTLYEASLRGGGVDNIGIIVAEYTIPQAEMNMPLPFARPGQSPDTDELQDDEDNVRSFYTGFLPAISQMKER
ncbi:MAG TPA: protein phosphatase 2C domain-containing protein [Ktedonosporobacter sp.]|nr:protein phosphatase 2C domain-containing protein [Ktedonosporobacter sp.]